MKALVFILFSSFLTFQTECAKILAVFPAPGYSQFILAEKLCENLAKRGHQITVISPYKPNKQIENYTTIHTKELIEKVSSWDLFALSAASVYQNILETYDFGYFIADETLSHREVKKLLESSEQFDLVIVEQFFSESLMGFAAHFEAPLVLFSSIGPSEWNNHLMGNVAPAAISPVSFSPHSRHMNFLQRLDNFVVTAFEFTYKHLVAYPRHEQFVKKYFPKPIDFYALLQNASLMLLNSHVTTCESVPLPQGMVEVGGFFIEAKPLRKEIKDFLDKAADTGVILFSLGTNLQVSDMSPEILNGILSAFGKLTQKVMWKTEVELPNKPANVFTWKWLEQSDVLAHPSLQLFITHGGLLSMTEAVFHGVPIIGIPIFGDQKMNVARAVRNGLGLLIPHDQLDETTLSDAINTVLNDAQYHETARKLSNLMRDVAVRPVELAMFSIESVIRQKGARFRPAASDLYWFQLYSVDVVAFGLVLVVSFIAAIKYLLKLCMKQVENASLEHKENVKKLYKNKVK